MMTEIFAHHFPRVWAARHDETVSVSGDGHVYGKAERRANVRRFIQSERRMRARQGR